MLMRCGVIKIALFSAMFLCAALSAQAQVNEVPTDDGRLEFGGTLVTSKQSVGELYDCVRNLIFLVEIEQQTLEGKGKKQVGTVAGSWKFNYYVDNLEVDAGLVGFDYTFVIKQGELQYRFFNFTHWQGDSKMASLGAFPAKWSDDLKRKMKKEHFLEVSRDVRFNAAIWVRQLKKYCLE